MLLIFSLLFYSWGEPKYIVLMVATIVANFFIAKGISRYRKYDKLLLTIGVIFNIGMLFVFKYTNFFLVNIGKVFNIDTPTIELVLPIGVSFYVFQILSYVIDVYRGKVQVQNNICTLGTYISFFPQLIAGPIVRYASIEKQLARRTHSVKKFCSGLRRFMAGFAKKILIANNVALLADAVFNNSGLPEFGWQIILVGTLAYTLQIYYDFSGYSDMAIGLGKMFGFKFEENFNYPYSATSITDFWRRWHISLSVWFRDYVYIPLGGNRCSKLKWIRNFLVIWLLTGFWHGASWNYVLWGLFYAVILLFEKIFLGKWTKRIPGFLRWVVTFAIVNVGWILFRVESGAYILMILKNILLGQGLSIDGFLADNFTIVYYFIFVIAGMIFMFPVVKSLRKLGLFYDMLLLVVFIISIFALVNNSYNPFIYFRF